MSAPKPIPPEAELDIQYQALLKQQAALGSNVQATATLLRFALQLANGNLLVLRDQLMEIRDMAARMETDTETSEESEAG